MATRKSELVITCNAKAVKDVFEYLNRQLADVKQKLKDLNAKGEKSGWTEQMKKDFRDLTKQATAIDSAIIKNQQSMVKYGQVLKDLSGSKLKDLKSALREATTSLNKMSEKSPGRQKLIDDIKRIKDQISGTSGLTMSFRQAQTQLKNLDNTSMDKLKQGLAAIKAQLDNPNIGNKWRRSLEQMQQQYQAAMAVRTAPTGAMPVAKMNAQQLGAERTALMSAIAATSGVKGYEGKAAGYEQRLKAVNEQLKLLTDNEKKADQAAKQLQATQEAAQTVRAVYRGQAVELEKLQAAYRTLQARQQQFAGTNDAKARAASQQMALLKNRIDKVTAAMQHEIKIDKEFLRTATNQQLQNALTRLQQKLQSLDSTQSATARRIKADMKAVETQINRNTAAVQKQGGTFGTAIKNIAAYVGVFGAFNMIKSKVMEVYKSNLKLSDSLADIRKVSGLTSQEIDKLYMNISKIDSRNTIETLNKLAYTGAKLGIGQNYGVQGLTGFVRAAEQVQMALGEDLGEEALPALAKLTEVMNLIPRYGVEQAMQKAASAIFQLGATSTATGKNIVEFSKRLMGLANVSRVSADELLAIGSAADAMGLMPEVAATAFNKLFTSIQKNHNLIEKSLQLEQGSINANFAKGQTIKSIIDIFDSMNKRGNMNALDGIFKDLGSDGARLVAVMTTMADRVDILKKHLETSTKAFKDGTAVINEYMIQNETANALMERAQNLWAKAFTNPEGVDMVKQLAQEWYEVSKALTQSEGSMKAFHNGIEGITSAVITLIKMLPFLIKMLTWFGIFGGIRMMVNSFAALVVSIRAATTATATLQAVMNSNWVLAGIAAVVGGISLYIDHMNAAAEAAERAQKRQAELDMQLAKSKEAINTVAAPLESYKRALDESNYSLEKRNQLMKDLLKSDYQQYLDYLGIEIDGAIDLAKAYAMVVKVLKQKKAYEEREQYRDEVNSENKMERMRSGMKFDQATKAMGLEGYDQAWLQKNQGRTTQDIYGEIMKKRYGQGIVLVTGAGETYYYDPTKKERLDKDFRVWNSIANYQRSYRTERNTNLEVNELYKNDVGDFDMDKFNEEVLKGQLKRKGTLVNEKPDKAAIAAAKKAAQDEKQALRKDLQDAKQDSDAVISKIEEWYRLQETVITDMQADGKLTKEQAEQVVRTLNIAKNTALRDARLAISGRDTEAWDKTKQQIGDLMLDQGKWSQELLEQILGVSMESIRANLAKIDKGGGKYGITTSSLKDAVDKNAAGNQREIARLMARAQQEVEKIFMEYDFFEQAMRGFSNRLAQMGILSETARNMADRLADANDVNTMFSMKDYDALLKGNENAKQQMLQAFIATGAQPYGVNPEDKEQLRAWFMEFVGEFVNKGGVSPLGEGVPNVEYQYQSWAKPFEADFDLWLRDSDKYLASIQSFYLSLMKSEEDYYEKRKQSYNHYKKQLEQQDQAAGIPTQREDTEKRLQTKSQLQDEGIGASFWRQQGLGGIMNDPEVMLIQQRIQWRNEDLESAKALLAGKEALWKQEKEQRLAAGEDEASIEADLSQRRMGFEDLIKERQMAVFDQQLSLTTKIAQEMRKRVQTINTLTKPIQDGAQNVGKKFGEMIRGVEEDSMTWNEIWRSMAQAVGDSIVDMMAQYAQNMIMEKMMNQQSKSEALSKAQVDVAAGTASAAAKTVGQLGWWGLALIPVIAAVLHGLLAAAFASNKQSDTSKSSATKIKHASGMLTYDEGNVQTIVGDDGRVYRAREQRSLPDGVKMISEPIATTVNGQQALVGERGPEIVIGRKTTRAIQMNRPDLLRDLAMIDRGITTRKVRTFDEGNISDLASAIRPTDASTESAANDGSQTIDAATAEALRQMPAAMAAFAQVMTIIQQQGIPANLNMYGDNGAYKKFQQADKFYKKYGG